MDFRQRSNAPITARALVECCANSKHVPLAAINLSEAAIKDKAKADWFAKSLVILQISWILVSCITRTARHLPISQLEICTAAFAVLSICTYAANWWKPQDVDLPLPISIADNGAEQCGAHSYLGHSFFRHFLRPYRRYLQVTINYGPNRVKNDFILSSEDDPAPSFSLLLAISTALFGGLHCVSWQAHFATRVERVFWLTSCITTTTIPLATLVIAAVAVFMIRAKLREFTAAVTAKYANFPAEAKPIMVEEGRTIYRYGALLVTSTNPPPKLVMVCYYPSS